jgi:hypothetical protein
MSMTDRVTTMEDFVSGPPSLTLYISFFVQLLGAGAIACSVLTALSCEFFAFEDALEGEMGFVDGTTSIGVFSYGTSSSEDCFFYDHQFWNESSFGEYFMTAQLATIVAPSLATVALFLSLVECACCRFKCSFILPILLYFAACLVQASTFFMMYIHLKDTWYVARRLFSEALLRAGPQKTFAPHLT